MPRAAADADWIMLDLDDCVADFSAHYYSVFNAHLGTNHSVEDNHDYSLHSSFGGGSGGYGSDGHEKFYELARDLRIYETVPPVTPDLAPLLQELRSDFNLHWVTARGHVLDGPSVTRTWLETNGFPIDKLTVCNPGEAKHLMLHSNTVVAVEDNAAHLGHIREHAQVPHTILVDRPWNRTLSTPHIRCSASNLGRTLLQAVSWL